MDFSGPEPADFANVTALNRAFLMRLRDPLPGERLRRCMPSRSRSAIRTLSNLQVERLSEWAGSHLTAATNLTTALRPLSFGLVIVLFLMFEPRGIANWWRIVRSYVKLWPFRY